MPSANGKVIKWRALARDVLVVGAFSPARSEWAAYVGSCAGKNHQNEAGRIASHGAKLTELTAEQLLHGERLAMEKDCPAAGGVYRYRR